MIDGHTAFTGRRNLADEYINQRVRFGHWKDTAVLIKGKAVDSFTMMFLRLWDVTERDGEEVPILCPPEFPYAGGDGIRRLCDAVCGQPASTGKCRRVGVPRYFRAFTRRYVHITTPYLILDDTTLAALKFATSAAWSPLLSCAAYTG